MSILADWVQHTADAEMEHFDRCGTKVGCSDGDCTIATLLPCWRWLPPDRDLYKLGAFDALELPFLQNPQKIDLCVLTQFADFVKEK